MALYAVSETLPTAYAASGSDRGPRENVLRHTFQLILLKDVRYCPREIGWVARCNFLPLHTDTFVLTYIIRRVSTVEGGRYAEVSKLQYERWIENALILEMLPAC